MGVPNAFLVGILIRLCLIRGNRPSRPAQVQARVKHGHHHTLAGPAIFPSLVKANQVVAVSGAAGALHGSIQFHSLRRRDGLGDIGRLHAVDGPNGLQIAVLHLHGKSIEQDDPLRRQILVRIRGVQRPDLGDDALLGVQDSIGRAGIVCVQNVLRHRRPGALSVRRVSDVLIQQGRSSQLHHGDDLIAGLIAGARFFTGVVHIAFLLRLDFLDGNRSWIGACFRLALGG